MSALVEIRGLTKQYPIRRGVLRRTVGSVVALEQVDLDVHAGECLAVVGESGSGKSTLAKCLVRLIDWTEGSVSLDGSDLATLGGAALQSLRRQVQIVFQDPYSSLNPRMRIEKILREPLRVHRLGSASAQQARVAELLDLVGLPPEAGRRFPHEFSGGQRQRIGIARALATEPKLLVADEPVSALDVSVRAQILNLLNRLRRQLNLTVLIIAHDLSIVEQIADRVAVFYWGRLVELGDTQTVFSRPRHPYTASLLRAIPIADPTRRRGRGAGGQEALNPTERPAGCAYHPRCPGAEDRCRVEVPLRSAVSAQQSTACFFPERAEWHPGTTSPAQPPPAGPSQTG